MNIRNKLYFGFTLILLLFNLNVQTGKSQTLNVKASIDTSSIQIGDQVKFRIEIDQPENAKLQIPIFTDTITGTLEIIERYPADTVKKDNLIKIKHEYLVSSFDSGTCIVPSIAIPFTMGDVSDTLRTLPVLLEVTNLPVDTVTQVIDIKPPMKTPINFAEAWPYLVGFIILAGFLILIWLLVTRKKKAGMMLSRKIQEPPHITALRNLDNLRSQKLWQNNKTKQYYVAVTEIIRTYIEHRFDVQALEMTTDEIVSSFKHIHYVDQDSRDLLKKLFTLADLVKFAKAQPLPDENEISLLNAYQFVNNTKAMEPAQSESENNTDSKTQNDNQVQNQ